MLRESSNSALLFRIMAAPGPGNTPLHCALLRCACRCGRRGSSRARLLSRRSCRAVAIVIPIGSWRCAAVSVTRSDDTDGRSGLGSWCAPAGRGISAPVEGHHRWAGDRERERLGPDIWPDEVIEKTGDRDCGRIVRDTRTRTSDGHLQACRIELCGIRVKGNAGNYLAFIQCNL
jgi:hypothetical protein